jgi:hypothetical protein
LGKGLLVKPPELQSGPATKFEAITVPTSSMQPIAEFIVMAIEAGRKDKAKEIRFKLQLDEPELWVLP